MADVIIKEAFMVSEEIAVKIASGEYIRKGGTVRDLQGQIVKHLEPVDISEVADKAQGILAKSVKFIQEHKTESVIIAIGAGALAIGVSVYVAVKKYEPKAFKELRTSLVAYIDAIRTNQVTLEVVENLAGAIEAAKKHRAYEKLHIDLTVEEVELLAKAVSQNTSAIALEAESNEKLVEASMDKVIIFDLEKHLSRQRDLLAA